jgi:type VI secretion system FHA domain protein
MNLVLTVLSGGQPSRHMFGPEGGRFGRSQKCDWVLSDPDCILSSIHGRIHLHNGTFILVDESTNGIFVGSNSEPLGKGNSVIAADGMRFRAGTYLIEVRLAADQAIRVPDTQAMGYGQPQPVYAQPQPTYSQPQPQYTPPQPLYAQPQAMPATAPRAGRAEDALRQRSEYGDLWSSNSQDPLAYLDGDANTPRNDGRPQGAIPAGFYPEFPEAGPVPGRPLPPIQQSTFQPHVTAPTPPAAYPNPSPYDGLAGMSQPGPSPSASGQAWPDASQAHMQSQRPAERGIPDDFLARLAAPAARPASPAPMPMAAPPALPAAVPPAVPSPAATKTIPDNFDPFTSLGIGARKAEPAAIVSPPRIETPLIPPRQDPPIPLPLPAETLPAAMPVVPVVQPPVEKARAAEPLSPALMADVIKIEPPAVLPERRATPADSASFDPLEALRSRREERTAALERKARGQSAMPVNGAAMPVAKPVSAPSVEIPAMPVAAPLSPQAAGGKDAIVAALFRGMGFPPNVQLPADGEKVAESVGLMVREIAEGLVQLLSARQMLKSEFRMDETQMRPEENNPFKYYKIAELALDEMFVTKSGGFQDPAAAAASAFADIQQYVMLTTAAIQRAMTLMFQRLSPEAIAREAEGDGGLRIRGLGGGKGKWETYVESHARMSGRLDGLTKQIISEAFAQVQEEQARKAASEYWEKNK